MTRVFLSETISSGRLGKPMVLMTTFKETDLRNPVSVVQAIASALLRHKVSWSHDFRGSYDRPFSTGL